ncbi:MAG TPA: DNA repair protein RecO [Actinomycetota bacterium]|jgi:DNA repair protein RecO (recombination protein O)|nr:DNA repair protein RecO [Actinomycetota bacterium]
MPLYKDQGIVLGSVKLAEADKIVTILTQSSGKIRAVAKGIRRTTSKFGARLEPFTHVDLMLYRGRSLDTVTQAEILHPFRALRDDFALFSAGEAMLEATDKVAEEHERNVRLFLLLLQGLRALERRPADPAAVAEAFLLRLLGLSGFAPALLACAVCGTTPARRFSHSQGGAVCEECQDRDSVKADLAALAWLDSLTRGDLDRTGDATPTPGVRGQARALLYGFAEYHLERRMRSLPLLARTNASAR